MIGALGLAVFGSCQTAPDEFAGSLPAQDRRVAFQSQCAQNVIECTSSWPVAVARVVALPGQSVTPTAAGFRVRSLDGSRPEPVQLVGSESQPGEGASAIFYSWTSAASDPDPCTLEPGMEFSTEADPRPRLQHGVHYIRLTVRNDIVREQVVSDPCGLIGENIASFDFVELEVEVVH